MEAIKKTVLAIALIFALGSGVFFAVNIFEPTNYNEYTGRARAFDLAYWNCIAGSAVIVLTGLVMKIIRTELEK